MVDTATVHLTDDKEMRLYIPLLKAYDYMLSMREQMYMTFYAIAVGYSNDDDVVTKLYIYVYVSHEDTNLFINLFSQ